MSFKAKITVPFQKLQSTENQPESVGKKEREFKKIKQLFISHIKFGSRMGRRHCYNSKVEASSSLSGERVTVRTEQSTEESTERSGESAKMR